MALLFSAEPQEASTVVSNHIPTTTTAAKILVINSITRDHYDKGKILLFRNT